MLVRDVMAAPAVTVPDDVAPIARFATVDQAVQMANDTEFGLVSSCTPATWTCARSIRAAADPHGRGEPRYGLRSRRALRRPTRPPEGSYGATQIGYVAGPA